MAYILIECLTSLCPSASVIRKSGSIALNSGKAVPKYVNYKAVSSENFIELSTIFNVYATLFVVGLQDTWPREYRCAPGSTGNTFQDLTWLRQTPDNTERYIHV
jgi:hypothetical protein